MGGWGLLTDAIVSLGLSSFLLDILCIVLF
jgi:hypothetical protein